MILCPAVENLGERGGLPTSGGQVLLQHEYEHDIAFGGEVRDILGNDRPAFRPGGRRHLRVVGRTEAGLSTAVAAGNISSTMKAVTPAAPHAVVTSGGSAPPWPGCGRSALGPRLHDRRRNRGLCG